MKELMNNGIYGVLLEYLTNDLENFSKLLNLDNPLGLGPTVDDILEYLEFTNTETVLDQEIHNKVLITEGDILSVLKIVHDISFLEGDFLLYINAENEAIISYLIKIVNKIFIDYDLKLRIKIDYDLNYNAYKDAPVTIIGSEEFVNTAGKDFQNKEIIIV